MPKQKLYARSFWKKLDKFMDDTQTDITKILAQTGEEAFLEVEELTPVKFGGLKSSLYYDPHYTLHGFSVRIGYSNEPHINYDPAYPSVDPFTNQELAKGLERTKRHKQMYKIQDVIRNAPILARERVNLYFKAKGGKK